MKRVSSPSSITGTILACWGRCSAIRASTQRNASTTMKLFVLLVCCMLALPPTVYAAIKLAERNPLCRDIISIAVRARGARLRPFGLWGGDEKQKDQYI